MKNKSETQLLRSRIKSLEVDLKDMRRQRDSSVSRANGYQNCLKEILMALGEHGSNLSLKWVGAKIGEMLR